MIVVDASALVHALLRLPGSGAVVERLFGSGETLHAPHLIDIEVAHVVRRFALRRELGGQQGRRAIEELGAMPMQSYPHEPLLLRVWAWRDGVSACDAVYLALAEELDAPLVTRDRRLAAASGHRARVEVV